MTRRDYNCMRLIDRGRALALALRSVRRTKNYRTFHELRVAQQRGDAAAMELESAARREAALRNVLQLATEERDAAMQRTATLEGRLARPWSTCRSAHLGTAGPKPSQPYCAALRCWTEPTWRSDARPRARRCSTAGTRFSGGGARPGCQEIQYFTAGPNVYMLQLKLDGYITSTSYGEFVYHETVAHVLRRWLKARQG